MARGRTNPNGGVWSAPFLLSANQDQIPEGMFLLPVCTNRERFGQMLDALYYYKNAREDYYDLTHMIDVLEAIAHIVDPSGAECLDDEAHCRDYPMNSAFIEWNPTNPYINPDEVPDGYATPPFDILEAGDTDVTLYYLAVGDVMAVSPPIAAGLNFPRFRVTVTGEKEVELHLLTHPFGGDALISVDGDLIPIVVDLHRDLTAVPPESAVEIVQEIQLVGMGVHTIDVTFIPALDNDLIDVGFGGGVRKITICGDEELTSLYRIRQNEENPCIIEEQIDGGAWDEVVNMALCQPCLAYIGGVLHQCDPITGEYTPVDEAPDEDIPEPIPVPPRPESDETDARCLAAANAVNVLLGMHQTVFGTYFAGIVAAVVVLGLLTFVAFTLGIGVPVAFATGNVMILLGVALSLTTASFTEDIQEELRCILFDAASVSGGVVTFDYADVSGELDARTDIAMWTAIDVYVTIIGENGLNLAGATTAITEADCDVCADVWCHEIFTGFSQPAFVTYPFGTVTSEELEAVADGALADAWWWGVTRIDFPAATHITRIEYDTQGLATRDSGSAAWIIGIGEGEDYDDVLDSRGFGNPTGWSTGISSTMDTDMTVNRLNFSVFARSNGWTDGYARMLRIRLQGTGDNPFQEEDNCEYGSEFVG